VKITHEKNCQPTECVGISELHSLCGVDITGLAASLPRLQVGLPCHGRSSEHMGRKTKKFTIKCADLSRLVVSSPPNCICFFLVVDLFSKFGRLKEKGRNRGKKEEERKRKKEDEEEERRRGRSFQFSM